MILIIFFNTGAHLHQTDRKLLQIDGTKHSSWLRRSVNKPGSDVTVAKRVLEYFFLVQNLSEFLHATYSTDPLPQTEWGVDREELEVGKTFIHSLSSFFMLRIWITWYFGSHYNMRCSIGFKGCITGKWCNFVSVTPFLLFASTCFTIRILHFWWIFIKNLIAFDKSTKSHPNDLVTAAEKYCDNWLLS